jgi:DNA-binding LacI/PurR family transcriptional regulator
MISNSEYAQLYNRLKGQIDNGELAPGKNLPSEREIMEIHHVSRTTVRRALELLEQENYVVKRPGIGCTVQHRNTTLQPRKILRIGVDFFGSDSSNYRKEVFQTMLNTECSEEVDFIAKGHQQLLHGNNIDGAILTHISLQELNNLETGYSARHPIVFLNRTPVHPSFAYFAVDYEATARRLVTRLLNNGASRVAIVGLEKINQGYAEHTRSQGWAAAYREVTGEVPTHLKFEGDLSMELELFITFLQKERPQVVFCTIANRLPLVIAGITQAKLEIGTDVDIICFDNVGGKYPVPVSYIKMPLAEMLTRAVRYIANPGMGTPPKEILEAQLVVDRCRYLF